MKKLQKNQILTVTVADLNHLGFGVAKVDGMAVFISGAVTGDVAEIRLIKVNASYAVAKLEKLLTPSPLRTDARCSVPGGCGGCAYREIEYREEKRIKRESVVQSFKKAGLSATVAELISTDCVTHYRNKAQYPIALEKGEYKIGFYAPKSHRVIEAASCPLAPALFPEILEELRSFFRDAALSVYDEETGRGLLRHVYLRRGEVSGEILLTLVLNGDKLPRAEELVARLTARFPEIVGILLNVNTENTNVILGKQYFTLYGRDFIRDTLADVTLEISAPAFYQVNHDTAELLYKKARELAAPGKDDLLLDLFCGTGSIGLSMANDARALIGIEIVDSAVECARRNAAASGIKNAKFYTGDATETERLLERAEREIGEPIRPDVVILDPPRKGCDEKLLSFVAALAPKRIVYVSCNPETLARDVAILAPLGYAFGEVTPVDMFPGTGHVESVVCLTRRLDNELRRRMN